MSRRRRWVAGMALALLALTVRPSAARALQRDSPPRVSPPLPPRDVPVRVGGSVPQPRRTRYVAPVYPTSARATHSSGTVVLDVIVDDTGAVSDVRVLRSAPLFNDAAIAAVRRWRYTPTTMQGRAIHVTFTVSVQFHPSPSQSQRP